MDRNPALTSLRPEALLDRLDLDRLGIDRAGAPAALLEHYRRRFPRPPSPPAPPPGTMEDAEAATRRTFRFLGYPYRRYAEPVDWEWDPCGDIEWVACVYRFGWAPPLADAYEATSDERYAQAFVELASDWIAKHPLERHDRAHRTLTHWRGFAWLDIQTGIRASTICRCFPKLVHARSFTPEFLVVLLASLHDHQTKSELIPMTVYHNKALMELAGFAEIAAMFPEFRESHHWLEVCAGRLEDKLAGQVTADGVQREWSFGYHCHVLGDAVKVMRSLEGAGLPVAPELRSRLRLMYEFLWGWATPELETPMFGDTRRQPAGELAREERLLYRMLCEGAELFDEPRLRARARGDLDQLPPCASFAWREAGLYALRSGWGDGDILFALHDSPPAISGHDQDDNGTFELYAFGRWLLPDSGYYTYGHDPQARAWHRQTAVHQTLTLGGANSASRGTHRLWVCGPSFDAVCADNASYPDLVHRRTVWFPGRRFVVILDEAIGRARGAIDLHYQLAPGEFEAEASAARVRTRFPDANVDVSVHPAASVELAEEEGWMGWDYNKRVRRPAFRFRSRGEGAPAAFVTVLVPYRGRTPPRDVLAALPAGFAAGSASARVSVELDGERWELGRDLAAGRAWCARLEG